MRRFRHLAAPWVKNFESQRVRFAYERPVYNVHRLLSGEKVTLDGNPDEAFWQKIKPLPLINPKGSSKSAGLSGGRQTRVGQQRNLWNVPGGLSAESQFKM